MKKGILLLFMLFISMGALFAQSLNDKITAKIERYVEYREGGYHDAFAFSISITENIPIRMYAFGIYKASDHTKLDYLEKYTFGLQYGCVLVSGYTCMDDNESIYKSNTNQWIIEIKYVNTNDKKEYVKNFITPLNSELNRIQLEEYKGTTGIKNPKFSKRREGKFYDLYGNSIQKSYKGIIISNGRKYMNKR